MNADAPPIAADYSREVMDRITRHIIGAAQRVSSQLGAGFVERVYENALTIELRKFGYPVEQHNF